jgi:transposase
MRQIEDCGSLNHEEGESSCRLHESDLDLAKRAFQVYGVDAHGKAKLSKRLARGEMLPFFAQLPASVIGVEACGGAHYWARELGKLGHTVRLMAAQFVNPHRKSGKNDVNDAEAICEAVGRPNMRFVPLKSEEQQALLMVHRTRSLVVANRTAQVNQIRGLLGEFGLVVPVGLRRLRAQLPQILEDAENGLPILARQVFADLLQELHDLDEKIQRYDRQLQELARQSEPARRIMALEGIGPITATAFVASVGDAQVFKNGRQFAAWLVLTPRQHSSGGTTRLGRITKRGDRYLRMLLVHGARAHLRFLERKNDPKSLWIKALRARRHVNVASVALAAKHARIIWVLLAKGTAYRLPAAAT